MFLLDLLNVIKIFCRCIRGKFRKVKELSTLRNYTLHNIDKLPKNFSRSNYHANLGCYGRI